MGPKISWVQKLLRQGYMLTLVEQLNAIKLRADQARARQRKIEVLLGKRNRKRDLKLKVILGSGAVAGGLIEQCLQHVAEADCALAHEILQEQAAAEAESAQQKLTDTPQDPPTA